MFGLASDSFCLIEADQQWFLQDIALAAASQQMVTKQSYIEVLMAENTSRLGMVTQMLIALYSAYQQQIPIIFNRSASKILLENLPLGFAVGLQTSGTTGAAKLIFHRWASLKPTQIQSGKHSRWLLCYHPMSFAGLQVILQALLSGDTLIAATTQDIKAKAQLAIQEDVTCLSLTPSLFRAMVMCWQQQIPELKRITFGGEICEQSTLDLCHQLFPAAEIRHIYALTEAGIVFSVKDGKAGFPASWLEQSWNGWTLQLQDQQLCLSRDKQLIFTGDNIHQEQGRCFFSGRLDNIVNVGGHKVDMEQLERQLLQLPKVLDVRVYAKKNPITGYIIAAEILSQDQDCTREALQAFNHSLSPAERPRLVQFVDVITLSPTGKKQRVMP